MPEKTGKKKRYRYPSVDTLELFYKRLHEAFGPQHWWPGDTPLEIAIGAILTQNTNWANVEKAIHNLKKTSALHVQTLHEMPVARLASLIRPAGYFNIKAKRLKAFIEFLMEDYRGSMKQMKNEDTDSLRKKLLSVHGIGFETADSILLYACSRPIFVIDAYTKRVLSRHGIMAHEASYEAFQELFHSTIKREVRLYNEYHALVVRVGKTYCKPKPVCTGCPLDPLEDQNPRHE